MQNLKAVYENGVFHPLGKPQLAEGQSVQLTIDTTNPFSPEKMLELAAKIYEGLSETDVDEIEGIALNRDYILSDKTEK